MAIAYLCVSGYQVATNAIPSRYPGLRKLQQVDAVTCAAHDLLTEIVREWYSHRYDHDDRTFNPEPMTDLMEDAKKMVANGVEFDVLGYSKQRKPYL